MELERKGWPKGKPRNEEHPKWQECRQLIDQWLWEERTSWRELGRVAGLHCTSLREAVLKNYHPRHEAVDNLMRWFKRKK